MFMQSICADCMKNETFKYFAKSLTLFLLLFPKVFNENSLIDSYLQLSISMTFKFIGHN
jgi:hypothetical protein